jgi:hypothetical protein
LERLFHHKRSWISQGWRPMVAADDPMDRAQRILLVGVGTLPLQVARQGGILP